MRTQITPTNKERVMRDDDFIISKTDLTGKLTYGNRTFIEFSGYTEKELLGAPHSIIRHPDMPRAVFKLLWDTIQKKKEIFAYVKNMAKDGSFYWVIANVTPSLDNEGNIIGYYSVRRKPKPEALEKIKPLYAALLEEERKAGRKDAVEASTKLLNNILSERKVTYEEFILGIAS